MNSRYKITRLDEQGNPSLSIEECKAFFAQHHDFTYEAQYVVSSNGTHMTIPGHFFMWHIGENQALPFRFFDGELYVSVSHPIIFDKLVQLAELLQAQYMEG